MSDLICRKTMMRCQTPGTCSPHGGCQSQHDRDSSELRRLCAERDQLRTANQRLRGEVERWKGHVQSMIDQTTPLLPVQGDPMWSRRIQLDEVIAERDTLRTQLGQANALLASIGIGFQQREMPSEYQIGKWAEAIDAHLSNQAKP